MISILTATLSLGLGGLRAQDAAPPAATPPPQEAAKPATPPATEAAGVADFLDDSPEALGAVSNEAIKSAQAHVTRKNWVIGRNKDGRYIAVGSSPIAGKPTDYNFPAQRVNAHQKAMLDAKTRIAGFYESNIRTEVVQNYGTGSAIRRDREAREAAERNKSAGMLAKARLLLTAKLDRQLREEGVALDSPDAARRAGELLNHDSFSQLVEITARASVTGLVCSKIFEENGQMAVVAYYSESSRILARAIEGKGNLPKVEPRKDGTLKQWVASLPTTDLYPSIGVQLASDEEGNLVLLSYAQAPAQTESKNALRNARSLAESLANGYIRQFAGELVTLDNTVELLERAEEFDSGVINELSDSYQDTTIRAVAGKLAIAGIQDYRTSWQTKDKRSGKIIVGVVRGWSLPSAQAAREESRRIKLPPRHPAAGPQTPATQASGTDPVKNGAYQAQSIESEDF
ncbi:MAG: hypothetical protein LBM92_06260 [Opitutaceae bacterium]|nr:hypothetical protein [Opitutaceae bacterium]